MPTNFPTNPDTYTTKVDGVDNVMAVHINDLQDATTAIEQALLGDIPDGNVQYVKKAASSTDNAIPRFDGTDGKKIQNSGVTVDDSNNIMVGSLPVPTSVATSTDNAIPRFDGTDGKKLQNSGVIINDNGQLSGNGLDGWIYDTDTWTYVSATSFKITGKDVRDRFPKGTKIKLVQSGSQKYFYVIATAYTSGNTTITITGGSDYTLASAAISGQAYSYAASPQGFPLGTSAFIPLITPATSTSWDGDSFSTTSKTLIDLSSVFGVPAGVKAVYVQMAIRDSASSTTDAWIVLGADNTAGKGINFGCGGLANDMWARPAAIVPCNTDGDIYYQINASGTSTFDVYLFIWGYWL